MENWDAYYYLSIFSDVTQYLFLLLKHSEKV